MPKYTDPSTGKIITSDVELTSDELEEAFGAVANSSPMVGVSQPQQQGKSVTGFIGNALSDTGNVVRGVFDLATNRGEPILSDKGPIMGLINMAKGGGQALLGSYMPNLFPQYAQMDTPAIKSAMTAYAPIGESILNPSGIPERIVNYAYDKPISTALNISAGAGALGKVAEAGNLARTASVLGTVSDVTNPINAVTSPLAKAYNAMRGVTTVEDAINYGINKGIRPSVETQRSFPKMQSYQQKAQQAVNAIIENKNSLQLTDEFGDLTNKLPENLHQFSQAIDQTKRGIFDRYNQMAKNAGQTGTIIDLNPIAKELNSVANNKVLMDISPSTVKYARERIKSLGKRGSYTVEEAQEAIQYLNSGLDAFYKNPSFDTASKAYIDSLIANRMRKGLDGVIENAVGTGYQELKNQYGALKSIERDVNRRAVVDARKNNKGLIDFSDIFSGSEVVRGIVSMNPASVGAGVAARGIARLYKMRNDPNRVIKKMFETVENPPQSVSGTGVGMVGNIMYQAEKRGEGRE